VPEPGGHRRWHREHPRVQPAQGVSRAGGGGAVAFRSVASDQAQWPRVPESAELDGQRRRGQKNADLVILDGDPTVDVANLDLIWAVFLKGRYLSQASLQALKDGVANAYRLQTESSFETRVDANAPD
jgi:hypothetical protein